MWILKTNVAVGCHLVNLALEEVSVEFHSTILTLGIMSKLLLHSLNQMVRCRHQGQDGSRNRISPRVFSVHRQSGCVHCPYRISPPRGWSLWRATLPDYDQIDIALKNWAFKDLCAIVHKSLYSKMCDISPNNVSLQIQSDYWQKQNHRMMTHLTDISKMKTVIEYKNSLFNKRNAHLEKCAFLRARSS